MSGLSCKSIYTYTGDRSVCFYDTNFPLIKPKIYIVPELDFYIDDISFRMFRSSPEKNFVAVETPMTISGKKIFSLQPLTKHQHKEINRLSEHKLPLLKYKHPKKLGQGAYGSVIGHDTPKSAVKTFNKVLANDIVKELAIYRLLKEIDCVPVLHSYDIRQEADAQIQFEKGVSTLKNIMGSERFTFNMRKIVMLRLAKCLNVIQSQGILHGDLKPANIIFINPEPTRSESDPPIKIKIIDWGLAEIDYSKNGHYKKFCGKQSLFHRAPEIDVENPFYNYKIDVFSLGIIFYELYTKKNNFLGFDPEIDEYIETISRKLLGKFLIIEEGQYKYEDEAEENKISLERYEDYLYDYNDECKFLIKKQFENDFKNNLTFLEQSEFIDLLSGMLELNPVRRFSYNDIIMHPFFQTMKRESVQHLPKFINNMPELKIVNSEARLKFILYTFNDYKKASLREDTLFLTIQLADLLSEPSSYNNRGCMVLASHLFEEHPLEYNDEYGKFMIVAIKKLDANILIPTLFSYYIKDHDLEEEKIVSINAIKKIIGYYMRVNVYTTPFKQIDLDRLIYIELKNSFGLAHNVGISVYRDEFKLEGEFYVSSNVVIKKDEFEKLLDDEQGVIREVRNGAYVIGIV